jgi:hypothetical protein
LPAAQPRQFRCRLRGNGIEPRQADTRFQAAARPRRVVLHLILKGIAGGKANMIMGEGIAKRDRALAHHMIVRRDQHQPVFGKRKCLQFFGGIELVPDDADLGDVFGDFVDDVVEQVFGNLWLSRVAFLIFGTLATWRHASRRMSVRARLTKQEMALRIRLRNAHRHSRHERLSQRCPPATILPCAQANV